MVTFIERMLLADTAEQSQQHHKYLFFQHSRVVVIALLLLLLLSSFSHSTGQHNRGVFELVWYTVLRRYHYSCDE